MSRSARAGALMAIVALAPLGCSTAPATELVVLVRVDPMIASPVTAIAIDVRAPDGELVMTEVDPGELGGAEATLGVRHRGGALSPLTIEARGLVGSMVVLDRAVTSFVSGERRLLVLTLRSPCLGVACVDPATTCGATGSCVSAERPGESLPPFRGDQDLDSGVPHDAPPTPTGDRCLFSSNCFFSEHCADTATAGRCVPEGSRSADETCSGDEECDSGACVGVPGFLHCGSSCTQSSDCETGAICVADALTGSDGACVPSADAPCAGCAAPSSACVAMRGAGPVCTTGPLCTAGSDCGAGESCALLARSAGGQAACSVGGACDPAEMSVDAGGVERCADTTTCDVGDPSCTSDHPECLPGTALGLTADRAGELGLCVRSL